MSRELTAHNRQKAAERRRRCRQREKAGRCVLSIEVDEVALADKLVEAGFLSHLAADDRGALRLALEQMIEVLDIRVTRDGTDF